MTTIAWDGKTLASDSLGDQNGLRMPTTKLHRGVLTDGCPFIIGISGQHSWANMLYNWVRTLDTMGVCRARYPDQDAENDPTAILVLGKNHAVFYKTGATWATLERKFHAVGSGRDFAIAAMYLGGNAKDAIKLAIEFDVYSGGEIRTMEIPK